MLVVETVNVAHTLIYIHVHFFGGWEGWGPFLGVPVSYEVKVVGERGSCLTGSPLPFPEKWGRYLGRNLLFF